MTETLMEIMVRDYKTSDYEACRSLWGELAQHHADIYGDAAIAGDDPGRGFDEYLKRADLCGSWIAEYKEKIVGFVGLLDTVGNEGVAEIEPVITTASLRNEGVGTRLIERVINEAKIRGFRFLSIRPELRNERAFDLYVRLGFDKIGAVELFQELSPASDRKWKAGIKIHNRELSY
ncbi:GNAT family N-acetyltransferase [Chloroflexota bacterium]